MGDQEKALKGKKGRARNLILHLHPPRIRKDSIRYTLTFGLGGMAALLFLIQILTGILLRFNYVPTPGEAYDSILGLKSNLIFGNLVRNLHHWSGIFFVFITFLHLLRTFYTGAFYRERRWNWIIGLCLMVLVILSNFTGYLLPWDQLAYWAVTVSTAMLHYIPFVGDQMVSSIRGGTDVNSSTLLLFYNFHTAVLPITLIILMSFHFWRVRKNKGVVLPEDASEELVPADPDLVSKELVVSLVLIATLLLLSIFSNAPLLERANPANSPNPAKAAWYFMGVQELLLHLHPFFAALLIPSAFFLFLTYLPFFRYKEQYRGRWFMTEKGRKLALYALIAGILFTMAGILADEYLVNMEAVFPHLAPAISNGLIPLVLLFAIITGIVYMVRKRYRADKSEVILFLFTFLMAGYTVMTLVGIFFRGPGMKLVWIF
ncbi:MAG: cytochrome b N-terminal domain-containing protein [bacterium]